MIVLDERDKRPLYEQVCEKLTHLIVNGVLQPDEKLPSVRNLAMELSINPNTIQRAYAMLEQDGYIYVITGRGNFVAQPSAWQNGHLTTARRELEDAITQAQSAGLGRSDVLDIVERIYEKGRDNSND